MQDYQGALEDYNEAIQKDPNFQRGYNNRANLRAEHLHHF